MTSTRLFYAATERFLLQTELGKRFKAPSHQQMLSDSCAKYSVRSSDTVLRRVRHALV